MSLWRRLTFWRTAEAEMQEELKALQEIAPPHELGNLTYASEEARAQWRWTWLDSLFRDVRYAVRVLARQPSFTAVALLSLGLGIGANAAIFSLVDRVLWRQLPVHEPERLATIPYSGSYYAWQQYRARGREILEDVLGTTGSMEREISTGADSRPGQAELVTGNYFDLLGVPMLIGRSITEEDDARGRPQAVAVLSYGFWQREYAADPSVLGREIRVARLPFTVIGVARPEFFGITVGQAPDLWIPLSSLPQVFPGRKWLDSRSTNFMALVLRLRPEVTIDRASAALSPLASAIDIERAGADLPEWIRKKIQAETITLTPASQGLSRLRERFSKPLQILFVLVGIVMLLACVNVMGLQFARVDERQRELNIRLAIGAGRWRIVRQLLAESLLLALAGGALGVAICRPAAAAVVSMVTQFGEPVKLSLDIDTSVLLYALGIACAAALVCGMAPALRATRRRPDSGLQHGTRSISHGPMQRVMGRTVALVQMALSVVLIAGAFLFAFSLYRLTHFQTGLDRRDLVVVDIEGRESIGYTPQQIFASNLKIYERLKALHQVEAVSYSRNGIYTGRNSNTQVGADGFQAEAGAARNGYYDSVAPFYFTTLRTRILAGRDFHERDTAGSPKVAIVNQEFARHFFPGQSPLGRNIYFMRDKVPIQVVGVVEDIRTNVRQTPRRYFFLPHFQTHEDGFTWRFVIRAHASQAVLRSEIRAADSGRKILTVDTADQLLNSTLDLDRLVAMLSFTFGILAIVLAAVGIYGLLAYDVTRRTAEIGVRMALGATRGRVIGMVFREVVIVISGGLAVGLAAALALGKFVAGLVFEMKPADPTVLGSAAVVLAAVAAAAAWIPAQRAASLDPMSALRHE